MNPDESSLVYTAEKHQFQEEEDVTMRLCPRTLLPSLNLVAALTVNALQVSGV